MRDHRTIRTHTPVQTLRALGCALLLTLIQPVGRALQSQDPIAAALRQAPADAAHAHIEGYLPVLERVYAARQYRPLRTDEAGLTDRGRRIVAAFRAADGEGLTPDDYLLPAFTAAVGGAGSLATTDVLLSAMAIRFAHDLGWGVTLPAEVDRDNSYPDKPFDAAAILERLSAVEEPGRALHSLAPASPAYVALKGALERLRAIRSAGGWRTVSAGPVLRLGNSRRPGGFGMLIMRQVPTNVSATPVTTRS